MSLIRTVSARALWFLGALGVLFTAMVPPVTEGCRYKAFLNNGVPFTPSHGELSVNTGVMLSELLLIAASVALLWWIIDLLTGESSKSTTSSRLR